VHPSTISRELHRNGFQKTYKAVTASRESDARRAAVRNFCKATLWFNHHFPVWLEHGISPEQIAHRLKQEHPDRTVSHEWIYRFLAADQRASGELYKYLLHRRKRYRKRHGNHDRRGQLRNRVSISERPAEIESRERLGIGRVIRSMGKAVSVRAA
jgi:IS30 family transposase